MSAMTIDRVALVRGERDAVVLPFPARPAHEAPLRVTRRGRLLLTLVVSTLVAVGGLVTSQQATAGAEVSTVPAQTVVVLPGDTLWSVAEGVAAPGEDVRDVVAQISDLNALSSSQVLVGQELVVPAD